MQFQNKRKVVIYARVSTEHEAQLSAFENQKDWYTPIVQQHPEWQIVKLYADEGITGTSATKRPQFMQMIKDAESGDFDLIITREVSRFARNTVDTLQYTRQLKSKGVEVFFINDNIKTFSEDGELRLSLMATLSQEESRKTSIRVKSGQQTSMEKGVFYGNGNILGYDRKGKDMVINPEQAKTVRMIYDMYLNGDGLHTIKFALEQQGRLTSTGRNVWYESNISKVLKNSFYCGIIKYHKQYVPDFLEQKKINNFGEVDFLTVQGKHDPIVTEEEYQRVQEIMQSRRLELPHIENGRHREIGKKQPSDIWSDLLICECGHKFNRKVWHRKGDEIQYGYQCYSAVRTGSYSTRVNRGLPTDGVCNVPMVSGWKMQMMAKYVFQTFLKNTVEVLVLAESMLAKHIDDVEQDNSKEIEHIESQIDKMNKRLHNLIEMRADGEITRDIFLQKKEEVEKQINDLNSQLGKLKPNEEESEDEETRESKIKLLKYYLEKSVTIDEQEDISDDVLKAFIVKIVAHKDCFDFYLRFNDDNPKQISVTGKRKNDVKISYVGCEQHRLQSKRVNL